MLYKTLQILPGWAPFINPPIAQNIALEFSYHKAHSLYGNQYTDFRQLVHGIIVSGIVPLVHFSRNKLVEAVVYIYLPLKSGEYIIISEIPKQS